MDRVGFRGRPVGRDVTWKVLWRLVQEATVASQVRVVMVA